MILTQFHIFLLVAMLTAIFYIGFIIGGYDRRMPKVDNDSQEWWRSIEDSEQERELLEQIKNKTEAVAECDECVQPQPF